MDNITRSSHNVPDLFLRAWTGLVRLFASSGQKCENDGRFDEDNYMYSKGTIIGAGVSGLVELSPCGFAVKSPWPGWQREDCRYDMTLEAEIYETLGQHERLVKILHWDPEDCVLIMEYMPNGSLDEYLSKHNTETTQTQRFRWAAEACEGLHLLHTKGVLHCDMKPKNLLLDADLHLKVTDFSSSSFRGSTPTGCAGVRFMPPGDYYAHSVSVDLFALGSTIYTIMTGKAPYEEVDSDEVWPLYSTASFPDTSTIACGDIIVKCWTGNYGSAEDVKNAVNSYFPAAM